MYHDLRVAVVIPAFCEQDRIVGVVRSVPAWADHIIVVDDGSTDRTSDAVRGLRDSRLVVLQHSENRGVGAAVVTGFAKAAELGAQILVKMDGDGQMDPACLPALLDPIVRGEADYTKGNRFLHARALAQMPWGRRIGNIGLSFLAKLASGYWSLFDPNNGFVALHATVWRLLDHERLHPRFFFENSMLLELGLNRAVVRDVHMPARYGDKPNSLSPPRALVQFPPLLARGFLRRLLQQYFVRDFTPVSLFLIAGAVATAFGAAWGVYHWRSASSRGVTASTGTVMIAVLPIILGVQLLLQAIVLDIQNVPRDPLQRT